MEELAEAVPFQDGQAHLEETGEGLVVCQLHLYALRTTENQF